MNLHIKKEEKDRKQNYAKFAVTSTNASEKAKAKTKAKQTNQSGRPAEEDPRPRSPVRCGTQGSASLRESTRRPPRP